ncbi:MAG: hypothetical protein M0Z99_14245 [Betaproteobacteria bacterium]|nr:hypothetical protein [Betaproteobacteria bacterium]
MKLTRKRKRLTCAKGFEEFRYQRLAARTRVRFAKKDFLRLDDILDFVPGRSRRRIVRDSNASLREQRRRVRAGVRANLNYRITVVAGSDLPRAGVLLGHWLYLEAADAGGGEERTVAILAGGPLEPPLGTPRHRWHRDIDAWFSSPQADLGTRKSWQRISVDGMQGALAVAAALDAMNPTGPLCLIKKGRSHGRSHGRRNGK